MKTFLALGKLIFYSVLLITTIFILSTTSFAAIFEVTNLDNSSLSGSLRSAILAANANMNGPGVVDEIVFKEGLSGTIPTDAPVDNTFTGEMAITDDLTITGPGANVITVDAQLDSVIFRIADFTDNVIVVSISGLMLINGSSADGGAISNREELSVDSCVFENNRATIGGAISNLAGTIENITNSIFSGNMALSSGGAIINSGGTIQNITNSIFSGNISDFRGGAIFNTNSATIDEITNSTFSLNSASNSGGAIYNDDGATIIEITNSTFSGNSAVFGGAIINSVGTIQNITNSIFSGNSALDDGGAIFNTNSATIDEITNSTITTECAVAYSQHLA